ncbi:MAG: hypothetical protein DRR16_00660 [Candidatus Parabeggiatoa sp. nov. 3]|nr:MAG: hypothetical protein DRR00_06000 [Gammaproteobacteria bacterium]RKZ63733.1 MAG: hypothetical protein DRQ99_16510 [Gammaproteobacteria bacterium]RKZ90059.1 MAG: hypothetical protein DRR16_00660 [Gammaproteobacteria bacterium]
MHKKLVRIVKDWDWPDLKRQTPNQSSIWDDITFTIEPVDECDYVIVLNGVNETTTVKCPPKHIWSINQEPPVEFRKPWHLNPPYSFRTFTTDAKRSGSQYVQSQPALPWHVNRDYDFLIDFKVPEKNRQLSWITSSLRFIEGHRARMRFLDNIRGKLEFDLIATYEYHLRQPEASRDKIKAEQAKSGFICVEEKWDGLVPYQYVLAIENFSNEFYWSEKLADCFLAWCMPIYYGCTRITDYFPAEALIQIDINAPDVVEQIKSAVSSNAWQRNLDAIAYARELILNRYQFFPFVAQQIRHFETTHGSLAKKREVTIHPREHYQLSIRHSGKIQWLRNKMRVLDVHKNKERA